MNKKILLNSDLSLLKNNGYSFFMEAIYYFRKVNFSIKDIPIIFNDRLHGSSKIPKYEILNAIKTILIIPFKYNSIVNSSNTSESCPLCKSEFSIIFYKRKKMNMMPTYSCTSLDHSAKPSVYKCLCCGVYFLPREEVPNNLDVCYQDVIDNNYIQNINSKQKTFSKAFNDIIIKLISPKSNLLEIGSYCGLFINILNMNNIPAIGIEPSNWAVNYAKNNKVFNILNSNIENFYENIDSKINYNIIVAWDVIEHISDPLLIFKLGNKVQKSGDHIVISTIYIESKIARLFGFSWPWIMNMHIFYFGTNSLKYSANMLGYKLVNYGNYTHYTGVTYAFKKILSLFYDLNFNNNFKTNLQINIPIVLGDVKYYTFIKK